MTVITMPKPDTMPTPTEALRNVNRILKDIRYISANLMKIAELGPSEELLPEDCRLPAAAELIDEMYASLGVGLYNLRVVTQHQNKLRPAEQRSFAS